ncbi:MAG: GFA family protein [Caulobacteraceae bacterium]|nr:GFA family protein [Caulobacteraceae bacterium]
MSEVLTGGCLTGGCLCGGVRYRYAGPLGGPLGAVTVCHCGQCRRAQGLAAAVAPARAAGFELTQGADLVREYESSPGKIRAFCGVCGSPLYSRRVADPAGLRLRLGSLDAAPEDLKVQAHIHVADLPAWAALDDDAPRYAGVEPGRRSA